MRRILPSRSVKRPGSPIAEGSGSESKKRSPEKVEILEDAWLEALKHLTCPKWSKMRLVSRQLDGLIERNVSRLPMAKIDSVEMNLEQRNKTDNKIIAKDSPISPNQKIQWFKNRGISLYKPADIELNNAIIGFNFHFKEKRSFDLRIQGDREKFNTSVLFKAEFNPHRNKYSWPCMAYFLKLLYDPSTYVEELSMYTSMCPFDSKLKDILFPGEEKHYIRCGSFKLQMTDSEQLRFIVRMSLLWLEQNVQADSIEIPPFLEYDDEEICDAMSNFLLGVSWISASQEVSLGYVNVLEDFFRALIKKFRTLAAVQSTFPIIVLSGSRFLGTTLDVGLKRLLSGKTELEDPEDDNQTDHPEIDLGEFLVVKTYTISNGPNRMQIKFMIPIGTVAFPRRRQTACQRAREPPAPILPAPGRQLATKAGRGPRPAYFDIRVTVETGERNAAE
ncbi:hypothetical protein DdX_14654 [Ditylenchus destructor]|uniref:Uncharacterized protein n=1 Tax=Ditylenchus destructor TaxID=166010 RepID=A0AAD4MSW0_9BILA|nr:hypothetical protein DdX_14654 [Ditylenchus destructor]